MNKFIFAAVGAAMPVVSIAAPAPVTPSAYVMKAGAGDLYEIQSSQLVLQTTVNPTLKSFAEMMVNDHNKSTADVKTAAMASGLKPQPPVLDPTGVKNISALRAAKGAARDRLYLTQQKAAHQKALALHQSYANSGAAPSLKKAAAGIVPAVKHHIQMLSSM